MNKIHSMFIALSLWAPAYSAWSQELEPEAGTLAETGMTLTEIVQTGGWLMYVLAAMSLVGLAFTIYFFVVLRSRNFVPEKLLDDVERLVKSSQIEEARRLCEHDRSPTAAVIAAALNYVSHVEEPDPVMLTEIMEGEGSRQSASIQTQVQYLLDIAAIAPMVGLLGTVIGMLSTFNVVALDIAKAKPMLLAAGVSKALITTAGGLMVGIPAMVFYAFFRGRVAKLLSSMEMVAADLLTMLIKKKS